MPNANSEGTGVSQRDVGAEGVLDSDGFRLEQVVFECRLKGVNYRLWDRAGEVASHIVDSYAVVHPTEISPAKIVFLIDNKFEVTIDLNRVTGISLFPEHGPDSLIEFFERLAQHIFEVLEIESFGRLGLRVIQFHPYSSFEDARDAFLKAGIMGLRDYAPPGLDVAPHVETAMRWELDGRGLTVRIKPEARQFSVNLPAGMLNSPATAGMDNPRGETGLVFDVDSYVNGVVTIGQLNIRSFIRTHFEFIQTERARILTGI